MRRKQPVTIYDIAFQAKVSPATVSRVLGGSTHVAPEKRAAVLAAAQSLNYRPNLMAQDLARGRSQTVGLILPDTVSSFWGRLVNGVETALREQDYHLLMASADGSEGEKRALDLLLIHQVDGLVIAGGTLPEDDVRATVGEVPFVAVLRASSSHEELRIVVQNREGARLATDHLIGLGHTRIAHITGPLWHGDASERQAGFIEALARAGIEADPTLVIEGDFKFSSGLTAVETLLRRHRRFTAVFASTDQMALGAILGLHHHGIDVPGEVSVVGFDDETFAAYCRPPLTTVRQPMFEIGQAAVRNILARFRGEAPPLPRFSTTLCVRESTARAKESPAPARARIRATAAPAPSRGSARRPGSAVRASTARKRRRRQRTGR